MGILEAIILGIVQGLTEFLPVSSSGHIELVKAIFGTEVKDSMTMTVVLHFATALSTCVIFRKDIIEIIKGLFQFKNNEEFRFSAKIVISMIPAAIIGLKYDDFIETFFEGKIMIVGFMLLVTGALLFVADRAKETNKNLTFTNAFIVGIAQMIAILPGISRSGATISSALIFGLKREEAARFSFLMVIPLIFGKIANDLLNGSFLENMPSLSYAVIGFLAAFLAGLVACKWMIALVKKSGLKYFGIYCVILAICILIYHFK